MNVAWELLPAGYIESVKKPDDITATELAVAACPGHLWVLVLEDNGATDLSCERCPAGIDDLYPDGVDLIYFSNDTITVEAGSHDVPDDDTPIRIPVTASVVSSRDYWGEYDVEMFVEPRDTFLEGKAHETESPVSHGS